MKKRPAHQVTEEAKHITRNICGLLTQKTFADEMKCSTTYIHKTIAPPDSYEYDETPHILRMRNHVDECIGVCGEDGRKQVIQTFNWILEPADLIVADKPNGYNTEGDVYTFVGNWLGSNSETLKEITDSMKDKRIDKREAAEILKRMRMNQFLEASFIKQLESIIEE